MKTFKELDVICLDAYSEEDIVAFKSLLGSDAAAIFVYNKNIYFDGVSEQIDKDNYKVKPEYRKGVIFAPAAVFSKIGASVTSEGITLGDKSLSLDGPLFKESFVKHGLTFLPVMRAAEALGLSSVSLYKNRLIVFGKEAPVSALKTAASANPAIEFAGGGVVIGKYDATKFTAADFKEAKDKWRASIVATPDAIDISDAALVDKIKKINTRSLDLWKTLNKSPDRFILWGDTPPVESCDLRYQYDKLFSLTLGYAVYGGELYHNEELKRDILDALRWMYENMYGEAELEGTGWRDIKLFNWWDWYVGAIEPLTDTMLIMEEYLTMEEKKKYLKVLEFVLDHWRLGNSQPSCSGRMSVGTKCALLLEDPVRLATSANDYHVMLEVKAWGDGTLTDYVNYQHGFPYNLMYGLSNLNRVLKVGANLAGTPLEFSSPRFYNQFDLFKYMYEAAMYRGRGFMSFYGRACTMSEFSPGNSVICGILPMIGNYGDEEDAYIRHFIKYSLATPEQIESAKRCSLGSYPTLKAILDDDTIPTDNDYITAHAWYTADRATQHKDDYAFLVSMPSYRHPNYESINHANLTGWHMNDGTLYLYTNNDNRAFDGVNFVLNTRLAQRMPGTTVDSRGRKPISAARGWRPKSDKVGCMDIDKKYIVAGMDYEGYNREEDEPVVDVGYGGGNPKYENDLVAKKAYFMLDAECVCLGAGINSTMNSDIITTVEHRRLVKLDTKEGTDKITVNGEKMQTAPFDCNFENPSYATVEGFAGYVFLDAERVSVSKYMYEVLPENLDHYMTEIPEYAKGARPFAEIMINHGKNPKNATYAYAVLPYADEEKTALYAKSVPFEILSNTPVCQAVRKASVGITAIVFYEAGECAGISADKACIVTLTESEGVLKVKACEPTNKEDFVTVRIARALSPVALDRHISAECADVTTLAVETELSVGEGYEATFKIK